MIAMEKLIPFLLIVFGLAGCTTMTADRYSVSMDVNQALKQYEGAGIHLASLLPPEKYDPNCRGTTPIKMIDGVSLPEFIQGAFNDEFKLAGIYDGQSGAPLSGKMDRIAFSSFYEEANGWWDMAITLTAPNGKSLSVENRYNFKSEYDGRIACEKTAQTLVPAVQDLIEKTVTDPEFSLLFK